MVFLPLLILALRPASSGDGLTPDERTLMVGDRPAFYYDVPGEVRTEGDVTTISHPKLGPVRLSTGETGKKLAEEWAIRPNLPIPSGLRGFTEPVLDVTRAKNDAVIWYRVRTLAKGEDGKGAVRDNFTVVTVQRGAYIVASWSNLGPTFERIRVSNAVVESFKNWNGGRLVAMAPTGEYDLAQWTGLQHMVPGVFRWQTIPDGGLRHAQIVGEGRVLIQSFKVADGASMMVSRDPRGGDLAGQDAAVFAATYGKRAKIVLAPIAMKIRGKDARATRGTIPEDGKASKIYTTIRLSDSVSVHIFQPEGQPEGWRSMFGIEG